MDFISKVKSAATVVQECVVTLEPVEQNLVEPIDLTFVPGGRATGRRGNRHPRTTKPIPRSRWSAGPSISGRSQPSISCSESIPIRASPAPIFQPTSAARRSGKPVRCAGGSEEARPWRQGMMPRRIDPAPRCVPPPNRYCPRPPRRDSLAPPALLVSGVSRRPLRSVHA